MKHTHYRELAAYLLTCLTFLVGAGLAVAVVVFLLRAAWRLAS